MKIERKLINYLNDFLFVAAFKIWVDGQVKVFMEVCEAIRFPVSKDKTFFARDMHGVSGAFAGF